MTGFTNNKVKKKENQTKYTFKSLLVTSLFGINKSFSNLLFNFSGIFFFNKKSSVNYGGASVLKKRKSAKFKRKSAKFKRKSAKLFELA